MHNRAFPRTFVRIGLVTFYLRCGEAWAKRRGMSSAQSQASSRLDTTDNERDRPEAGGCSLTTTCAQLVLSCSTRRRWRYGDSPSLYSSLSVSPRLAFYPCCDSSSVPRRHLLSRLITTTAFTIAKTAQERPGTVDAPAPLC